jgi:hypothetical protein
MAPSARSADPLIYLLSGGAGRPSAALHPAANSRQTSASFDASLDPLRHTVGRAEAGATRGVKRATNLPPQPNRQSGYGHQGQARYAGGYQGLSKSSAQGDVGRWNLRPWWQLQPVWPPMPTGSPSRYALHPCITRHPPAPAAIASLCIPASPFSHFLGRMLWGRGALGGGRAPPQAPCAFPLSLQPGRWHCLHRWQAVRSCCPVHHWAGSGLAIRCRWLQLVGVALVGTFEVHLISPAPITSRTTVTKCDDPNSTAPMHHRWRR